MARPPTEQKEDRHASTARNATLEVVDFLVAEKGLTPAEALSLASIAVDFRVSEVVDLTQVVTGYVPKAIFLPGR